MHRKWYEYAVSFKKINIKSKKILCLVSAFLVGSFSIPLFKYSILYWLLLILPYCLVLFFCFREKDEYAKFLLNMGSMLLFLALECAAIIVIYSPYFWVFMLFVLAAIVVYEIVVLVKVKTESKPVSSNMKAGAGVGSVLLGMAAGKCLDSFFIREGEAFWLMVILGVCLFIAAIPFIQKYVVYKVIGQKYTRENVDQKK